MLFRSNDTATTEIYTVPHTLSLHDALPISARPVTGGTGRNTWHTGSLPGTFTIVVRTYNGMSWAALFNRRDDASGKSYGDIDAALWTAANGVKSWPTNDFFPTYFA